jgi:hypothetical protein
LSREEVYNFLFKTKAAIESAITSGKGAPELPERYVEFAGVYNQWDNPHIKKLVGANNEPIAVPSACTTQEGNEHRNGRAFEPGDPAAVPFPEPGEISGSEGELPTKRESCMPRHRDRRPRNQASKPPPVPFLHTDRGRDELLWDMSLMLAARVTRGEMNKMSAMEERRRRRRERARDREERPRRPRRRDGPSKPSGSNQRADDRMEE